MKVSSFGRAIGVSPIICRFDSYTFTKTLALGTGTLLGTRQPYGYTNVLGVQKTSIKKTSRLFFCFFYSVMQVFITVKELAQLYLSLT